MKTKLAHSFHRMRKSGNGWKAVLVMRLGLNILKEIDMIADKIPTVPWYGLSWKLIEEKGFMSQIENHLVKLTKMHGKNKATEYLKYLKNGPQNNLTGGE